MLDMLMSARRKVSDALVDIDFSTAPLGSRVLPDIGYGGVKYTRARVNGFSPVDGVVDIPGGFGRGYYFDGGVVFTGDRKVGFSALPKWRMRLKVRAGNVMGTILGTGYYPPSGDIKTGWTLGVGQFQPTFYQQFLVQSGPIYQRNLLNGAWVADVVDEIIIEHSGAGTTITNTRTGVTQNYPFFSGVGESYWMIGGGHSNSPPFQGWILSLRIEALS